MNSEHGGSNDPDRQMQQQQYNSFLYKFQQQIIDAWKPVPYTRNNVILYSILTIICIGLGLALILTSSQYPEIQMKYGGGGPPAGIGSLTFFLPQTLPPPVYLYYGLSNYYQNHRRYLKFFSSAQMGGSQIDLATATSQCGSDADTNQKVGANLATLLSFTGDPLDPNGAAFPCGQRAKSFLQIRGQLESFNLSKEGNANNFTLTKNGIAWPDDLKSYKNSGDPSKQIIDNQDETWLVWFRPAAQNFFFKLHSIINQELPSDNYTFSFDDQFDLSYGTKYFHLSKANYMGNKDYLLGIAFLVLGGGCLIVLIIFIAKCVTQMRGKSKQN